MAKFKIYAAAGAAQASAGGGYDFEMEALEGADAEIIDGPAGNEDAFITAAANADALYVRGGMPITKKIIDSLARCRVISLGSVGVDQVDVAAATARGIPVTNCPDTFIEEVADHVMALLLASCRRVIEQDRIVREGRWREGRAALLKTPRLTGQTLGFIAFGHVARAVAARAKGFGLRLMAYDPYIEEMMMLEHGVLPATLAEVLQQSDFISMHAPATPEAQGMLKEKHFAQMKKSAIFINAGRGPTVDEAALIKALQEGWIAHAALDVLEREPPMADNPLLRMDNVTLSPHVASATARFDPARKRRVGQELALVLAGKWPMSCVNPAVLAKSTLERWQPVSMQRGPNS
jgi:D-3-phosphoglycerate dehydrogenase